MKQIHGNLTIDKVDATMDELREQHALGEEIASAITNAPIGEPLDEADLEEELEGLEQEAMDERMLKTGTVPVQGLPAAPNQQSKFEYSYICTGDITELHTNLLLLVKAKPEEEDEEEELRKWQAEMGM